MEGSEEFYSLAEAEFQDAITSLGLNAPRDNRTLWCLAGGLIRVAQGLREERHILETRLGAIEDALRALNNPAPTLP